MSRFGKISATECEWSRDEDAKNGRFWNAVGKAGYSASPRANRSRQARMGDPKRLISTQIN